MPIPIKSASYAPILKSPEAKAGHRSMIADLGNPGEPPRKAPRRERIS